MTDEKMTQAQAIALYEKQLHERIQQGDAVALFELVNHFEQKATAPNMLEAQTRINLLQEASNKHVGAASVLLAQWYLTGHYVPKDTVKAILFFEHAGNTCKDAEGFYRLAEIFERGLGGLPINEKKAADYLNKAVEMKHPNATFTLATKLLERSTESAFQLLKNNYLKQGHVRSLLFLHDEQKFNKEHVIQLIKTESTKEPFAAALFASYLLKNNQMDEAQNYIAFAKQHHNPMAYYLSSLVAQHQSQPEQAQQDMLQAAYLGHTEAAYRAGIVISQQLEQITDLPQREQALQHMIQLFAQAAQENFAPAQFALAQCWLQGLGLEQNQTEGLKWLERAAQQGHVDAIFTLAINLSTDHPQHFPLLEMAAQAGHTKAMLCAGMYLQNAGQAEQAIPWFNQAKAANDKRADYLLGQAYLHGQGIAIDSKQAMEFFKLASENGDADANFALYQAYRDGVGVRRNKKSQAKYLKLAQEANHPLALQQTE